MIEIYKGSRTSGYKDKIIRNKEASVQTLVSD